MYRKALVLLASLVVLSPPAPAAAADPPVVLVAESEAGVVQIDPASGAKLRVLVPGGRAPAL
ncbi:MAG: hypothetical protein QOE05_3813, partial [Actinomycetota bacterium]|nr:hypothetical protein [Actinomycetota bacterium]